MGIDDEIFFVLRDDRRERMESKGHVTVRKGKRYLFQLLSSTRFFVFVLISMAGFLERFVLLSLALQP